jgi:dolichol-phosphate mannosyltransferase
MLSPMMSELGRPSLAHRRAISSTIDDAQQAHRLPGRTHAKRLAVTSASDPRDVNAPETLGQGALIITPTYNERSNLEAFVEATLGTLPRAHLLIVDDNSPDGTGSLANEIAARDTRVRVLHRPSKLGLGTAYVAAFQLGLQDGYRYLFEMDADLSHDPKYLPSFLRELERGADIVIGSRNIPGGGVEGWGLGRHLLSKGGSLYSRTILGVSVRDLTSGYKAFRREALLAIFGEKVDSNGYSFQIEMTYRALRRGLKVVEVPIVFVDRRVGESKMDRKIVLEAVAAAWKLRLRDLLERTKSR